MCDDVYFQTLRFADLRFKFTQRRRRKGCTHSHPLFLRNKRCVNIWQSNDRSIRLTPSVIDAKNVFGLRGVRPLHNSFTKSTSFVIELKAYNV